MSYHLQLFGYPRLLDGDWRPLPFKSWKQLGVLVYLALEGCDQPVARGRLIEFFWPDRPPKLGRHSLSQSLATIRAKLGRDSVTRWHHAVRLTAPLRTDLDLLVKRGDLPTGFDEPLQGLDLSAGRSFAQWVESARDRCLMAARDVLSRQLLAARSEGNSQLVRERAAQLYRIDPYNESAVCAMAEQSLLEGDLAEGQRLLRSHLQRARDDLGGDSAPAVARLLRWVEKGIVRATPRASPLAERALQQRPEVFVGRDKEMAVLERLWHEARTGKLVTCLVAGPAGIGKSTLLRRFAAKVASRAAPVLEIACQEIGRDIPFAALSDLVHALTRDGAASGTDGRWLAEAARVCPKLSEMYPSIPAPPAAPAETVRFRVAEALLQMWNVVTDAGPGLLVIDDVPNLDQASREVLYVVLRKLQATPTLLLASSRTTVAHSLTSSSNQGATLDWHDVLLLPRLSTEDIADLIVSLEIGDDTVPLDVRLAMTGLAAGNPYLAEMLYSDWQRSGTQSLVLLHADGCETPINWQPPSMMRRAFAHQHHNLPDDSVRMLNLLSATGRQVSCEFLGGILGLRPRQAERAALELLDRGIIRTDDLGFTFKNQLHRDFVYGTMPEDTRRFLHEQIAKASCEAARPEDFQLLLEAAHHYRLAGFAVQATDLTRAGAKRAIERGAPQEAERAAKQLLSTEQVDVPQVHCIIAEAQLAQGRHSDVLRTTERMPNEHGDNTKAAWKAILRAEALHRGRLGDSSTVGRAAREALSASLAACNDEIALRALQVSAEIAHEAADTATINRIRSDATRMGSETSTLEVRASAATTSAFCAMVLGDHTAAADLFSSAVAGFRVLARDTDLRRALNGLGMCLSNTGESDRAIAAFMEAAALAERFGDGHAQSIQWDNLAVLYEDIGWFDKAAEAYQRALAPRGSAPIRQRQAHVLSNAAGLAIAIGNLEEAETYLDRAMNLARSLGNTSITLASIVARCDLHLARSDHDGAWAWADEAVRLGIKHPDAARRVGDFERVRRHFVWATQGYDAFAALRRQRRVPPSKVRQSQELERLAFEEWVDRAEGREVSNLVATTELVKRRLFGAIAHLIALDVYPGSVPPREVGETSAQLVIRAFRECRSARVPPSVGALQKGAESPYSP